MHEEKNYSFSDAIFDVFKITIIFIVWVTILTLCWNNVFCPIFNIPSLSWMQGLYLSVLIYVASKFFHLGELL